MRTLHRRTLSRDSICFWKAPVNSFKLCVCQHGLFSGKSNNHIPPPVLSFSHSQFLEGSIQRQGSILPSPEKGFKPAPPLLNGWEQAGPGFLWVTQLAMERPGTASFTFSLCLMAGQPHDFMHTHYQPIAMQSSVFFFFSSSTISHRSLEEVPPSSLAGAFVPQLLMRVIFVRMRDEYREANTPLSAPAIIGFGPYGGREICNCGPLGGTVGKTRFWRESGMGGLRRLWRWVSK